jgi:hypothetical protein
MGLTRECKVETNSAFLFESLDIQVDDRNSMNSVIPQISGKISENIFENNVTKPEKCQNLTFAHLAANGQLK